MKLNKDNFKKIMKKKIGFPMVDINGKKVTWTGEFPEGCDFLCLHSNTLISQQNKDNWCNYIGLEKDSPKYPAELEAKTKDELREMASEKGIEMSTKATKNDLIEAIIGEE